MSLRALMIGGLAVALPLASARAGSFEEGLASRTAYEAWISTLQGAELSGANFWAGQRSLKVPGSCVSTDATWAGGCFEAQKRLTPSDVRRKADPAFRAGWNTYGQSGSATTASAEPRLSLPSLPPPIAPDDPRMVDSQVNCFAYTNDPRAPGIYRNARTECFRRRAAAEDALLQDRLARERIQAERDRLTRQAEAQRQEQTRLAAQREQEERLRAEQVRLAAEQVKAEESADNFCKVPAVAKGVMEEVTSMHVFTDQSVTVVDIDHLVTESGTSPNEMVCRGVFQFSNGRSVLSRVIMKKNVAGDPIVQWRPVR